MKDWPEMLRRLGSPRIVVLGDIILDRYCWGNATRVSPEAPVLVLQVDHEEIRLGGAASVAYLARGLEAKVSLAGYVGNDASGRCVRTLLQESGIDDSAVLVDETRPTTTKERLMGSVANRQPCQMLRVDREVTTPVTWQQEEKLLGALLPLLAASQMLLISDYVKGLCSPRFLAEVMAAATDMGTIVLVDPGRVSEYSRYQGAALVTPNRMEAELVVGRPVTGPQDAIAAGSEICRRFDVPWVLIKLDSQGMVLTGADGTAETFPARPRSVHDVTGAGDMVLATLGLCRAARLDWCDAIQLANIAGGLEVEKLGIATVTRQEIADDLAGSSRLPARKIVSAHELKRLAEHHRRQQRKLVFTNGCFDLLHVGHLACLQEAATLGDILIVAINSDSSVRRRKGPGRPVISQEDRASLVASLECVDHVTIFESDTPCELLRSIQPDVLAKGGTYSADEVVGHEIVHGYGGQVHVTRHVPGISTTQILSFAEPGLNRSYTHASV